MNNQRYYPPSDNESRMFEQWILNFKNLFYGKEKENSELKKRNEALNADNENLRLRIGELNRQLAEQATALGELDTANKRLVQDRQQLMVDKSKSEFGTKESSHEKFLTPYASFCTQSIGGKFNENEDQELAQFSKAVFNDENLEQLRNEESDNVEKYIQSICKNANISDESSSKLCKLLKDIAYANPHKAFFDYPEGVFNAERARISDGKGNNIKLVLFPGYGIDTGNEKIYKVKAVVTVGE